MIREELTELEKQMLPGIKWLIDAHPRSRGQGRTTVLAHAFIQKAIDNEGHLVKVIDHSIFLGYPLHLAVTVMRDACMVLMLGEYRDYNIQYLRADNCIVYQGKKSNASFV